MLKEELCLRLVRYQRKVEIGWKGRVFVMRVVDKVEHHIAHLIDSDLSIRVCCCQDIIVEGMLIKQSDKIVPQLVIFLRYHSKRC